MDKYHGLLVIDKPLGPTSRAAVDRVRRWFPRSTRVGHTGTLDPLATGVLVMAVGAATRFTEYVQDMEKVYRAGLLLGARSSTDDAEGAIEHSPVITPPSASHVQKELAAFVGEIEQVPPDYSAAKVAGRRAYELARRGDDVALAPRKVRIYEISLLGYEFPNLEVEIRCGKGTYIRSLARDLGERLGCGGLIASLRRLRVGPFTVEQAISLEAEKNQARSQILPLEMAVSQVPKIQLQMDQIVRLRQGQTIPWEDQGAGEEFAVFGPDERFAGIATCREGQLAAVRMLAV